VEELAKLAYEAALRTLDKQEEVVRELRARTAVVLAPSSFAISLAGAPALRASPVTAVVAVAASMIALGASLYVLLPQPRLRFSIRGTQMLEAHFDLRNDLGEVYRRLVYDIDGIWAANAVIVVRLLAGFRWSAAALAVEIVFLVAALRSTL
jgi:hypothetical protein